MTAPKAIKIETHEEIKIKYAKEFEAIAKENAEMERTYQASRMKLTRCVPESMNGISGWAIQFSYNKMFLNEFKDAIPRDYREWIPATKSWWVNEECGGMLVGLFENWDMPISQPKNTMFIRKKIKCHICNDTGLVPSKALGKFSGKLISNCFSNCECRQDDHEYYPRLKPSDFDFPMSYDFRSFVEQGITGQPLPALDPPRIEPQVVAETSQPWQIAQWQSVQQTKAMVLHLNTQIKELRAKKKTQQNYEPF